MNRRDSRKVVFDGILFDSGHEAEIYKSTLKPLERQGSITQLQCHPQFTFIVNGVRIASMKPDFSFVDSSGVLGEKGKHRIWDAKGFKKSKKTGKLLPRLNRESGLKKKLMLACFGLDVEYV